MRYLFIIILLSFVFTGCLKEKEASNSDSARNFEISSVESAVFTYMDSSSFSKYKIPSLNSEINDEPMLLPFATEAHAQYLHDPLVFFDLSDGGIQNELASGFADIKTAVVGSDECFFYPIETISSDEDLNKLIKGELIPFASIIPLGEKVLNSNFYYDNMFQFQGKLNYFYKTVWNGKQGIVFGADLYGIGEANAHNRLNALLFEDGGHFESFYNVTGYEKIPPDITKQLEINGIAFQEIEFDNLSDLYIDLFDKKTTPVFVTTDLALFFNHLVFSYVVQYMEEEHLYHKIVTLTHEIIKGINEKKDQVPAETYARSLMFFQTAEALLALAPKKIAERYYNTIEYQNVDKEYVLSAYPQQVREEIEKIYNADDVFPSSIFPRMQEDYSRYRTGGHNEKNGILTSFFRALIWYSRLINDSKSAHFSPVMNLVTEIVKNNSEFENLWQSVFDTVNKLYGTSDFSKVSSLKLFEKGSGFYFTEKPEWSQKSFNSALSASTAHHHVSIVNIINNDNFEVEREEETLKPVFRTKTLPNPVHYLEPNVPFWISAANEIHEIYHLLKKYNYLDYESEKYLKDLFDLFCKAAEISMMEADDMPLTANDLAFIERFPQKFINIKSEYLPNAFSNIYRIYIPLNDKQGGKRIAVGFGFR